MTVADLLTSQRRWGQTRCRKFLQSIPMSESKTVGSMTDRQRHALAHDAARAQSVRRSPRPSARSADAGPRRRRLRRSAAAAG